MAFIAVQLLWSPALAIARASYHYNVRLYSNCDSSTIRVRFEHDSTTRAYEVPTIRVRYNILQHPTRSLRGVMRIRAIMNMSILLHCCTVL